MLRIQNKERILKRHVTFKGKPVRIIADLSAEGQESMDSCIYGPKTK
jgi:hypothetical protein